MPIIKLSCAFIFQVLFIVSIRINIEECEKKNLTCSCFAGIFVVSASVHQLEGDLEEDPDVSHPAKKCRIKPLDFFR